MPKRTLLQMVQKVAKNINSDEVTTLAENTVEINDITDIVLDTLEDIVSRGEFEFLRDRPMQLEAGTNILELTIPSTVKRVQTVKYRREEGGQQSEFRTLKYMYPKEYINHLQKNRPTDANTDTVTVNGVEIYPRNNRPPRYWTSFNETTIMLDSYDAAQNAAGIDATDSAILATIYLDFTGSDDETWVAPIPESLFPLWLQESTAEAAVKLRQVEDPRAERKARRSYVQQLRQEPVTNRDEGSQEVNYGR